MSSFSLPDLIAKLSKDSIVTSITDVATGLGLLPSDWVSGDPELTLAQAFSQTTSDLWNTYVYGAIRGGWLSTAGKVWLDWTGRDVYNTDRIPASQATGVWAATATAHVGPFAAGDVVWTCLDTDQTYTNAGPFEMNIGDTLPIALVADVFGTKGNAGPTRVVLQHTVLGLTGSNAGPINGIDAELDEPYKVRCRLKYASLSPNGPGDAYRYAALTPSLNGGVQITREKLFPDSDVGVITQIFAGPSGALSGGDTTTAINAIKKSVLPNGFTYNGSSAVNHSVAIKYTAYTRAGDGIDGAAAKLRVQTALGKYFQVLPIEGDIIPPATTGSVYREGIARVIGDAVNDLDSDGIADTNSCFRVHLDTPSADVAIAAGEVPVLGAIDAASSVMPV